MGLLDWLAGKKTVAAPDGFECATDDPQAPEHGLITRLMVEAALPDNSSPWYSIDLEAFASYREIAKSDREAQARLVGPLVARRSFALDRLRSSGCSPGRAYSPGQAALRRQAHTVLKVLLALLRKKLPLSAETLAVLLGDCATDASEWNQLLPGVAAAAEHFASQTPVPLATRDQLAAFHQMLERTQRSYPDRRKIATRMAALLGAKPELPLAPGEPWVDAAHRDLASLPSAKRSAWAALLNHCADANAASPNAKWLKLGSGLLKAVGPADFKQRMLAWFPLVDGQLATQSLTDASTDLLRGLAWFCSLTEDRELARGLTALTIGSFKKIRGFGPGAVRVGNAGVLALGRMPGLDAVGQLAILKVRVKLPTAQIAIEKALKVAAAREGLPREEIEEMSVPTYGLTEVGRAAETFGDFTAELTVTGSKTAELVWRRTNGTIQKSLPAAVKTQFAEEVKELAAAKKDIEKMLPAQIERLDSLFLQQKSWPLATWRERYLAHPLVGTLARRLIWNFTTSGVVTPGVWLEGRLVDRLGHPLALDAAQTAVTLWHPLDQLRDVVQGWRGFLEEWEIQQPFKQAHREVYVLTPAEEATGTYSNRFASHLLRQHQFHALCAVRGWKNKVRLAYGDSCLPATRLLPRWGLRAEFWIEGANTGDGFDTTDSGAFLHLSTDQVRFYLEANPGGAPAGGDGLGPAWPAPLAEPLALTTIPPLVFSEIMRDVDLFVGVTSVGNDPTWADGGRCPAQRDAWMHFSFGELTATAETRRELLEKLVPKLKIAVRCSFAERFLVVRGDLRTYKIHLGSGNILMSPNDQYLCIVPGSAARAPETKVFLPFEGDQTLSVILSKAFLLAADAKITDLTILRQIRD